MQEDRGLWYILGGVGALVVLALLVFFLRPQPEYMDESTPKGVVHNYLLALYRGDFERAYGYLADWENKPSQLDFLETLHASQEGIQRTTVRLGDATIVGDEAVVEATIRYSSSDPFGSNWSQSEGFRLIRQAGEWKIRAAPYPFWQWEWPKSPPLYPPGD